jgi:acetyl-CoA carboxylase biotin carboxyl carrier protein
MDRHEPGHRERDAAERLADHASIERLAGELVPALIAKLGASGLGEIEVREGDWKVRLRRPADGGPGPAGPGYGRRATDRPTRSAALTRGAPAEPPRPTLTPVGPGRLGDAATAEGHGLGRTATDHASGHDPFRAVATSPAVGYYQPKAGIRPGSRVRAGDPIGVVDVLGISQEVVAPADGIVGASLVEPGEAVEYGQELTWVELLSTATAAGDGSAGEGRGVGDR